MARAIDGDKLVENLRLIATCWSVSPYVSKEKHNGAIDMLREVEREVKKAPLLTPPNKWVSVEERLPNSQEDVLVVAFWHERWQTMVGWHSDMGKKWCVITPHGEREPGGVTHWMPLPAPPERQEANNNGD